MPTMSSREVIKKLKKAGWKLDHVTGSHHVFKKAGNWRSISVPHPKKDLPIGTWKDILKQAGLK